MNAIRIFAMLAMTLTAAGCNDASLADASNPQPEQTPEGPASSAPVAIVNGAPSVAPLDVASLDGSASYDPDGGAITAWSWEIVSAPAGSTSILQSDGSAAALFADFAGQFVVRLAVTDDEGESAQAEIAFSAIPMGAIHVELGWNTAGNDIDLHLVDATAGGSLFNQALDCYFSSCVPPEELDWGAPGVADDDPRLDIDDVDGFGPEHINVDAPPDGRTYHVYANYWQENGVGATVVLVRIYLLGDLAWEGTTELPPSPPGKKTTWDVATIDWPSAQVTVVGSVFDYSPF